MKNLFSQEKTPMQQMSDSLDQYSDPCSSFIAEGPKFYFGKEATGVNHDVDPALLDPEASLGREYDGVHSRKLNADYEDGAAPGKLRREADEALKRIQDRMEDPDISVDTRSELEKQADDLLADSGYYSDSVEAEPLGDFDVTDEDEPTIHIAPSPDEVAASREDSWDFSDLDDPDAVISKETSDDVEDAVASAHVNTAAADLADIADKLTSFPTDANAPADVRQKIAKLQADIAALKASLGENANNMISQAMQLLEEEAGQVVPTSGQANGVSVVSKFQDPSSGEVFVKAVDGRVFCVTVGMNGNISEVKRTSFNPAFPEAFVRSDKPAIDALGVTSVPKL